jgi:hypothetical protein
MIFVSLFLFNAFGQYPHRCRGVARSDGRFEYFDNFGYMPGQGHDPGWQPKSNQCSGTRRPKPHCTSIAASFRRVPCAGGRLRQGCERGRPRSGYAAGFGRSSESGFAGAGRVYIARPFILSSF